MVVLVFVLAILCHAPQVLAQQPSAAAGGQVTVAGRVVAADTAVPLAGARVTVVVDGQFQQSAYSDLEGRFTVLVPARGGWSLQVTKAGFAPVQAQTVPADRPLLVSLPRGAVVTGRIADERGEPIEAGPVRIRRVCAEPCDAAAALEPSTLVVESDDLGVYRLGSLPAGRYEIDLLSTPLSTSAVAAVAVSPSGTPLRSSAGVPGGADAGGPSAALVDLRAGEEAVVHLVRAGTAEPPPAPQSQAVVPPPLIRGRIIGPSGGPVQGASVRVSSLDGTTSRMATSDAAGRYEITHLPANTYRLTVTRRAAGSVPVEYGQTRAGELGRTITLRPGETLDGIDVRLPRGGVISGRVLDRFGEPLEAVSVQVWERRFISGRMVLAPVFGLTSRRTDDRGYYRLAGLLPGTYYVSATDALGESPAPPALLASLESFGQQLDRRVVGTAAMLPPRSSAAIYYPGSAIVAEAAPVRIEIGLDAPGTDITFAPLPAARIEGVAVDSAGREVEGTAQLVVSQRLMAVPAPRARSAPVGPGGRFAFDDVPPGAYVVQVVTAADVPPLTSLATERGLQQMQNAAATQEFGLQYVTVVGTGNVSARVQTSPPARVVARVVVDGDQSIVEPASFEFGFVSGDPDRSLGLPRTFRRSAALDPWSVEAIGLVGPARVHLRRAPAGWYVKSVIAGGADVADLPVELDGGRLHEIDLVVAVGGGISGRATDERGNPVRDYSVVAFATDPTRWFGSSRHLKLGRSGLDGAFTIDGLPPGEYWVVAIDGIMGDDASGEWQRPDVLGTLLPGARRVRVAERQSAPVDLRLMPMPGR